MLLPTGIDHVRTFTFKKTSRLNYPEGMNNIRINVCRHSIKYNRKNRMLI